jgi:lytic murein transglycosylase
MAAMTALGLLLLQPSHARAQATFAAFVESLWPDAKAQRISRATFDRAFRGVEPDLTIPDLELPGREGPSAKGQAEFTRPPQGYLDRKLLDSLSARGRALLAEHRPALEKIERDIGVDRQTVLAIWGRETAFGAHKPSHYAVRVLATLAWKGRRKELFRTELLHALRLLEDSVLTPETMRSSWAGAMGLTQFMPSEFYASGHDLDGDGKVDLFRSVPDALASAAKQLKQKGWTLGLPWGFEVAAGRKVDCAEEGPANARPIGEWLRLGITRRDGSAVPAALRSASAYLMSPGGAYGPQFLVTENFKVIRAYNTSDLYALFVGNLSDRILGGGDFATPWSDIRQLPTRDIAEIQQRLQAAGLAIDKIDGKIGSNTRWQIGLYQRRSGLTVDCWPTAALLAKLRGTNPGESR